MGGALFYSGSISFASGIFIRSFFVVEWGLLLAVCLGIFSACAWWGVKRVGWRSTTMIIAITTGAFLIGVIRTDIPFNIRNSEISKPYVGAQSEIIGTVIREPDMRDRSVHLTLESETINGARAKTRLLVIADRFVDVRYGDRLSVSGTIDAPESFTTDLGRTFDYPGYLAARGIYASVSFANVMLLERERGNVVVAMLFSIKNRFIESLERILPEPQAGLGEGLLLGVKRAIGEDLEDAFRTAGVIHIVVLSGYNITLVAEAVMRLLTVFFMPRTRFIIGLLAVGLFAVLVGLSATVVRASIMAALVLVARATGKTYAVMRALCVSAIIMLLINPLLLAFDPGFQLSFLATIGLILFSPIIERRLQLLPTTLQLREYMTATISTQLFVLPLLLYNIGEFSLISFVANPLVLVVVPFAMFFTFLTGCVGLITSVGAVPFGYAAHIALSYIIEVVEMLSSVPYASIPVPAFPFIAVIIAYVCMAFGIWYWSVPHKPVI